MPTPKRNELLAEAKRLGLMGAESWPKSLLLEVVPVVQAINAQQNQSAPESVRWEPDTSHNP